MLVAFLDFCRVGTTRNEAVIKLFGKNLRRLRLKKDVTQEFLAEECGMSQEQIARMEKGNVNTSISNLYALSEALNCSFDEFFIKPE